MKRINMIAVCLACLLAACTLSACTDTQKEQQTTAESIEQVTQVTTQEETTEDHTEQQTTEPESTQAKTETESQALSREDWDKDDPANPYYNLIEVGTSYDGKTPCYDGRYDFGYPICHVEDGTKFNSLQDAVDYLAQEYGGRIYMEAAPDVCLKVNIPDDGNFYRIAYWWLNCDFVMDFGVIYDDQNEQNGVVGYAYYSDLYELDVIPGLEGTYVWVLNDTYGLMPGYYKMTVSETSPELYYDYELIAMLDEWPGLPLGEKLPE
ncbi:MAG: hypothetical protein E7581_01485 [Ruminococcaceae bacterium]|nr:hypothetical protein [Oscillospiraceae bacterium]